jgi:hypothetical protein
LETPIERGLGTRHALVHAGWHERMVRPECHWSTLHGSRVVGDLWSHLLVADHASMHGLVLPIVSHWNLLWRCIESTTGVRHTHVGVAVCTISVHVVVLVDGVKPAKIIVVSAVVSSSTECKG